MKVVRRVIGLFCLVLILFSAGSGISSCKKEIVRDTIFVTDTLRIKDTVRIVDSSNCNCYDLKDGLVAYYNFNNATLNDSSGYNNHVTLNNSAIATADRFGKANNAYSFNGTSSYMKVANSVSLNPTNGITLSAIIKIKAFNAQTCLTNQIVGKGWNDFINGFYALRFYSTVGCQGSLDTTKEVFYANYGDNNGGRASNYDKTLIHTNIWYNVVYTYANGESKMYIDGILQSTTPSSGSSFTANTQEMYIGKHGDPQYPYSFNGVIDDIRIYNKALCANAVKQLYNLK